MLFYKELEFLENSITIGIKKPFLSEFTKTNKKRPKKGANPTLTDENGQFHGELRADISIGTQLDLTLTLMNLMFWPLINSVHLDLT